VHRNIGAEDVERPSRQYRLDAREQDAVLVLDLESSLDGQRLSSRMSVSQTATPATRLPARSTR
jgi:hypothetical protein